ncbi:MAG: CBS domain-containing protein [Chloroflexi bacterium]|nr:MAG: CBS domain-containing protein [Chloroflexota bacterium]
MFVRDRMSSEPITITPDTPFQDALKLMREHRFRRLPVVDKHGKLVGIVSERDLLYASPSPATSLSVWELNYLLSKLQVREIMTENVITTTPDAPIEDAARLIVDNKIGGLPVVDEQNHVVGVITETDIFKTFVEMLGGGQSGLRLTLEVPERKGVLAELARTIFDMGGNIVSVGSFYGDTPGERELVIKVRDVSKEQLVDTLEALGDHVLDARDV